MRFGDRSFGSCAITPTEHLSLVASLYSLRHCSGPVDYIAVEVSYWGCAVSDASSLVKQITGCERVYAIAFGEGAQYLHLNLILRHLNEPASKAWAMIADLYRATDRGDRDAANLAALASMVQRF